MPTIWEVPDDLWEEIEPSIDCFYPPAPTGRPRADLRRVLDGIIFRLRSGCQWSQLPKRFGTSSTVYGWFQRFSADRFLEEMWAYLVRECEELGEVHWEWQGAPAKAFRTSTNSWQTGSTFIAHRRTKLTFLLEAEADSSRHWWSRYRLADMTSLIRLQPETFKRLVEEASRRHETIDDTANRILGEHLPVIHNANSTLATLVRLKQLRARMKPGKGAVRIVQEGRRELERRQS